MIDKLINDLKSQFGIWGWFGLFLIGLTLINLAIAFIQCADQRFPVYWVVSTWGCVIISILFLVSSYSSISYMKRVMFSLVNIILSIFSYYLNEYFISVEGHWDHSISYFAFIFIIPAFVCCAHQIYLYYRNESLPPPPDSKI